MAEINIIEIIVALLPFAFIILASAGGTYLAVKRFIRNFADAIEDDKITKEELQLLIDDGLGIINVIKNLFGK